MEILISSPKYGNHIASIDDEDFKKINQYSWVIDLRKDGKRYARASYKIDKNKYKHYYMHRLVMCNPSGYNVDHKDNDGLNNRKSNLRVTPRKGGRNAQNRIIQSNNTTGFKGVHLHKNKTANRKYSAKIESNGIKIWGGYFETALEAAYRVNNMCEIHHQEFACFNKFTKEQEALLKTLNSGTKLLDIRKYNKPLLRGVSKPIRGTKSKPYYVKITVGGKLHRIGYFTTEISAAIAYNVAIYRLGGNRKYLNRIPL